VFDYGEVNRDPQTGRMSYFLAMELIEGETLEALIERKTALSTDEAMAMASDVMRGLKQAHSRGLIHRDLKPANIMLRTDEEGTSAKSVSFPS
jgi:serine/threonine protein kinase